MILKSYDNVKSAEPNRENRLLWYYAEILNKDVTIIFRQNGYFSSGLSLSISQNSIANYTN